MDRPAIKVCEAFAHAGYPLDVEALLIVEVEGSEPEIESLIARITGIAEGFAPQTMRVSKSEAESAAIWKGRKSAFGAMGRLAGLSLHGRRHPDRPPAGSAPAGERDLHRLRPQGRQHLSRRRWQPASPDPVQRQRSLDSGRPKRRARTSSSSASRSAAA